MHTSPIVSKKRSSGSELKNETFKLYRQALDAAGYYDEPATEEKEGCDMELGRLIWMKLLIGCHLFLSLVVLYQFFRQKPELDFLTFMLLFAACVTLFGVIKFFVDAFLDRDEPA